MTLQSLVTAISELAKQQRVINFSAAGTDIYSLNTQTIKDYPCLYVSPTGQHSVKIDTTRYTLTLFFLERLLNDSSNEIDILSVSIEELKNLIFQIREIPGVVDVNTDYRITNWTDTENFNDKLAGSYATIEVEAVNESICGII